MNVGELVGYLLKLDQNLEVYTAKDAEGNGYNSVYFEPTEFYAHGDGRSIEVIGMDDLEDSGYEESEVRKIIVI